MVKPDDSSSLLSKHTRLKGASESDGDRDPNARVKNKYTTRNNDAPGGINKHCVDNFARIGSFSSNSTVCIDDSWEDSRKKDGSAEVLTVSEIIRRQRQEALSNVNSSSKKALTEERQRAEKKVKVDIDEEIRRLEAELAQDSEDEGSGDDDDDSRSVIDNWSASRNIAFKHGKISFGETTIFNPDLTEAMDRKIDRTEKENGGIICFSELANDRIAPLPKSALPATIKSKKLRIDMENHTHFHKNVTHEGDSSSRRKRKREGAGTTDGEVSEGLREAVKEVLSGYVARSSERIPFYCRVCAHQSSDEKEFQLHRQKEFHKMAAKVEKKATYCTLCRKQFTSIVQMREHLTSRPHRDRMDFVKAKQRGGNIFNRDIGGGEKGDYGYSIASKGKIGDDRRGLEGRRSGRGVDNRQWC